MQYTEFEMEYKGAKLYVVAEATISGGTGYERDQIFMDDFELTEVTIQGTDIKTDIKLTDFLQDVTSMAMDRLVEEYQNRSA